MQNIRTGKFNLNNYFEDNGLHYFHFRVTDLLKYQIVCINTSEILGEIAVYVMYSHYFVS